MPISSFSFNGQPADDMDTIDIDPDTISQLLESFARSRARVSADDVWDGSRSFLESVRVAKGLLKCPMWLDSMEEEGLINRGITH